MKNKSDEKTVFEKSQKGQKAYSLPKESPLFRAFSPEARLLRKTPLDLPEVSEIDLTRHFSTLARRNMGIDTHFYPLGSCTMKLNPRINEVAASLQGFQKSHPLAPDESVQGNLELMSSLGELLADLSGMEACSLLPCAGAQGEYVGIRMILSYHEKREDFERREILIPDNAHGTNPATAAMAGLKVVELKTNGEGGLDLSELKAKLSPKTAGLMLTNPNTLGLFTSNIEEITQAVHEAGGLLYYDGANLNPLLAVAKPGEMGFDVMHINLHKTFSTPHGGGGPGSGPVLCKAFLEPFLPVPKIFKQKDRFIRVFSGENTIGQISSFHGNFGMFIRAYLYAIMHGKWGLRRIAEGAVLNANYLKVKLAKLFKIAYPRTCMHEFVVQADRFLDQGVKALDIAKRVLDYGVHAPTVYFPLIVKEAMLIEPTESESKGTLDRFVEVLAEIVKEIEKDPELVKTAPHTMVVTRLDEIACYKQPCLRRGIWK